MCHAYSKNVWVQMIMNNTQTSYHMTAEQFRQAGYALIDWIADYRRQSEKYPVLSQVEPGAIRRQLPPRPPQAGESFAAMMADVEQIIMPGITHWQSPNFFAYFPSNGSEPSILGELLSAGLGVQGMLWATSPACTELETHVLDWLVYMMDLPTAFLSTSDGGGTIQDSASSGSLVALLAAREQATQGRINLYGGGGGLTVYCSTQTHSSLAKGMMISGLGRENLRLIAVDEMFAMQPEALAAQIEVDIAVGLKPMMVCATMGTTSSNGMDPIRPIAAICKQHGIWLHVDAAMSGTAVICPEFRWLQDGVEEADSYLFNPHKWMFVNFDCDAFFVRDRRALLNALSILPEYLRNQATQSGEVIDYRDWQIPLGRRFRALKLWFVIRHYGVEGLQYHIREHVRLAQLFKKWVEADERFELLAPAPLNLVCFAHVAGDEVSQQIMEHLNASGDLYLTHTKLNGRFTLRMSIGVMYTTETHVVRAWQRICEVADRVTVN